MLQPAAPTFNPLWRKDKQKVILSSNFTYYQNIRLEEMKKKNTKNLSQNSWCLRRSLDTEPPEHEALDSSILSEVRHFISTAKYSIISWITTTSYYVTGSRKNIRRILSNLISTNIACPIYPVFKISINLWRNGILHFNMANSISNCRWHTYFARQCSLCFLNFLQSAQELNAFEVQILGFLFCLF